MEWQTGFEPTYKELKPLNPYKNLSTNTSFWAYL